MGERERGEPVRFGDRDLRGDPVRLGDLREDPARLGDPERRGEPVRLGEPARLGDERERDDERLLSISTVRFSFRVKFSPALGFTRNETRSMSRKEELATKFSKGKLGLSLTDMGGKNLSCW